MRPFSFPWRTRRMVAIALWVAILTAVPSGAQERLGAFPPGLVHFVPYQGNPVFQGAGPNHWDAAIRERGWILRENGAYKLWYTGYDGTREGVKMLGLATSADGVHWTRHPDNPLYADHWVEDMMVVHHEDQYLMFAEGRNDQAQMLTSADGVHWRRNGALDVRTTDGQPIPPGPYGTPCVLRDGGVWNLFYERRDAGIWLARSRDLKTWTNVSDEPVIRPGPETYDAEAVAMNQVIKHGEKYYGYYHGAGGGFQPRRWCCGVAVSDDLMHWTKYPANPLTAVQDNLSSGILVPAGDGDRFLFYTMHDQVRLHVPAVRP